MPFPVLVQRLFAACGRLAFWRKDASLDRRGELAAERLLKRQGHKIVARRERGRLGEIDLVTVDQRTVVFVEVKTRRTHDAGHPASAVDEEKQRRLTRLALAYLKRHDLLQHSARFDVVAVTWPDDAKPPTVEHYKNAFDAIGRGQMFS
jgi:putative endonuclease